MKPSNLGWVLCLAVTGWLTGDVFGAESRPPAIAEFNFREPSNAALPQWVLGLEQEGGQFLPAPAAAWAVDSNAPTGVGKLVLTLERAKLADNLALRLIWEESGEPDLRVQLLDKEDRVVAVSLFDNLATKGKETQTDTFVVPLKKYPSAGKLVLRRVSGAVRVYAMALWPVVGENSGTLKSQQELAQLLGDPLSPSNSLQEILTLAGPIAGPGAKAPANTQPPAKTAESAPATSGSSTLASPAGGTNVSTPWIESPIEKAVVPRVFNARGQTPALSLGQHLWLFVQHGRFLYPKSEVSPARPTWEGTIREDGNPLGGGFFVSLYRVTAETHDVLVEYKKQCRANNSYPAITEMKGAERVARVRVQLAPD